MVALGDTTYGQNNGQNQGHTSKPYEPQAYGDPHTGAPTDVPPVADPGVADGPKAPSLGGAGKDTAVDTDAIRTVADNVTRLAEAARTSYQQLAVDVHPGAFGQAGAMRTKVNGQAADFKEVLSKLGEGLTDLSAAMKKIATKYDETEDDNSVKATDATKAMQEASASFSAIPTAHSTNPPQA